MTDLTSQIKKLETEIQIHKSELEKHSFQLKSKEAVLRKLNKQFEKIQEILNEQLPTSVSQPSA